MHFRPCTHAHVLLKGFFYNQHFSPHQPKKYRNTFAIKPPCEHHTPQLARRIKNQEWYLHVKLLHKAFSITAHKDAENVWPNGGDGGGADEENTEGTEEDQPQESRIKNGIHMSSLYTKHSA